MMKIDKNELRELIKRLRQVDNRLMKIGMRVVLEIEKRVPTEGTRSFNIYRFNTYSIDLKNFMGSRVETTRIVYQDNGELILGRKDIEEGIADRISILDLVKRAQ